MSARKRRKPYRHVWTDGACDGAGLGGWAWVTADGMQASGGVRATTNQRMELHAALRAVVDVGDVGPVHVHSDSAYVVNCFLQRWMDNWTQVGDRALHKTRTGKPVANPDLWLPLFEAVTAVEQRWGRAVGWTHLRGHSGDPLNDKADELAVAARVALLGVRPLGVDEGGDWVDAPGADGAEVGLTMQYGPDIYGVRNVAVADTLISQQFK